MRALLAHIPGNRAFDRSFFDPLAAHGIELVMPELESAPPPEEVLVGWLQGVAAWFALPFTISRRVSRLRISWRCSTPLAPHRSVKQTER